MLKGLVITPPVVGRISIGRVVERNGKRLPEKDDQFTLTSQIQNRDGWILHPLDEALRQQAGGKLAVHPCTAAVQRSRPEPACGLLTVRPGHRPARLRRQRRKLPPEHAGRHRNARVPGAHRLCIRGRQLQSLRARQRAGRGCRGRRAGQLRASHHVLQHHPDLGGTHAVLQRRLGRAAGLHAAGAEAAGQVDHDGATGRRSTTSTWWCAQG